MGDRVCRDMDKVGNAYASEVESLSDSTRLMGGEGVSVAFEVNHMEWYRLRARVVNTRYIVWC